MLWWKSSNISWAQALLKKFSCLTADKSHRDHYRVQIRIHALLDFCAYFSFWSNIACVGGLPFFLVCNAETKHQREAFLNTFFTWWMAPWKFHGFIYAIILVALLREKHGTPFPTFLLPRRLLLTCVEIHHPSFLDFCPSCVLLVSILQSCRLIALSPYSFSIFLLNVGELNSNTEAWRMTYKWLLLQSEESGLEVLL